MQTENDTNETVDYEQTGGPGDIDPKEQAQAGGEVGSNHGTLNPGERSKPFAPQGKPPWTVTFTDPSGNRCQQSGITKRNAEVKVESMDPCEIKVD